MRTTIAAGEIFGTAPNGERRRLTIAVGTPAPSGDGSAWCCKIVIADVLPPTQVHGDDSFTVLARAVDSVRKHLAGLETDGWRFYRDRGCEHSMDLESWLVLPG